MGPRGVRWKTGVARDCCVGKGRGRGGWACHFVSATVVGPGGRAWGGGEGVVGGLFWVEARAGRVALRRPAHGRERREREGGWRRRRKKG